MLYNEVQNILLCQKDYKYQKFMSKLIPNVEKIIGVRMPFLKHMAKGIIKNNQDETYLLNEPIYLEEALLQALIIGYKTQKNFDFEKVKAFVPKINNWAVCDTFCTYLKSVSQFPNETLEFLSSYLKSTQEFEVRFALVLLLFHFVEKKYLPFIFKALDDFNHQGYYAQMGAAWLLSICFIKYPEQTFVYLKESKLDAQTFNRAIQKICESKAVDKKWFSSLRALKKY
ncbi:MAG: DNA alkylation repair protein [Alphaproteobacteria bacterium]|nr:DNA alkylation repair protein [Alphaproteobacteria bacterium]